MSRKARVFADNGVYHIVLQGIGSQILFEDDSDRRKMEEIIQRYKKELKFKLYSYVFMDNHVHLCIKDETNTLSKIMQKIELSYVRYFNKKYKRKGSLFQGRFWSKVVETNENVIQLVKYIIKNPEKAKMSKKEEYRWSSYHDYCGKKGITDIEFLMDFIETNYGRMPFKKFFNYISDERFYDVQDCSQMLDKRAIDKAKKILGCINPLEIMGYEKQLRNHKLRLLKKSGIPVWQLVRITGISRGIIEKA